MKGKVRTVRSRIAIIYARLLIMQKLPFRKRPLEKMEETIAASPRLDGEECMLLVTKTTHKTIELRALVSARNSGDSLNMRCPVSEEMSAALPSMPRPGAELENLQGTKEEK